MMFIVAKGGLPQGRQTPYGYAVSSPLTVTPRCRLESDLFLPMTRLLSLLMILALVITQGTSMAQAVCRHASAQEHAQARESGDARIAAVSIQEDAAAAAAAKKASQAPDSSGHWPAELLPPLAAAAPVRVAEPLRLRPGAFAPLASASIPPLLQPPSA